MSERRKFSRIDFSGKCTLQTGITELSEKQDVKLIDVSLKGALFTLPAHWEEESDKAVTLSFHLHGSDIILVIGGIICHQTSDLLGMRFLSLSIESISHLKRLVQLNIADEELLFREMSQIININEIE